MSFEYYPNFEKSSDRLEGKHHLIAGLALQSIFPTPEDIESAVTEMMSE